jgi:hypothetical protein
MTKMTKMTTTTENDRAILSPVHTIVMRISGPLDCVRVEARVRSTLKRIGLHLLSINMPGIAPDPFVVSHMHDDGIPIE